MALAQRNRAIARDLFNKIHKIGKVYQSENFGISYIDRGDKNPTKFAFIVSTKISKEAVDRNTIKRHMSETVRIMVKDIKDGMDILFLAKPSIMRQPASEISKEVRMAIKEGGFLKGV